MIKYKNNIRATAQGGDARVISDQNPLKQGREMHFAEKSDDGQVNLRIDGI